MTRNFLGKAGVIWDLCVLSVLGRGRIAMIDGWGRRVDQTSRGEDNGGMSCDEEERGAYVI